MPILGSANWILFFGHLHILLVHLPIGFLILLGILETIARFTSFKQVAGARGLVLILATVSVIFTAACGWLQATSGGYSPALLFWHRWLGTGLAVLCVVMLFMWVLQKHRIYYPLLVVALLVMTLAAHLGGSLTHGSDYLVEYAPSFVQHWFGIQPVSSPLSSQVRHPGTLIVYSQIIQPLLTDDCISCHGPSRQKAHLRLDSFAFLQAGSKGRPVFIAGNPDKSILMQRLLMPVGENHRMPPAGRKGLTADQIALIRWWIKTGAKPMAKLAELPESESISAILDKKYPVRVLPPQPLATIRAMMRQLALQLQINITPIVANGPWIDVNAALNHTMNDHALAQLTPLAANISELNLARSHVTDAGMHTVALMRNLQNLTLDNTAITDKGVALLVSLQHLRTLNLYATSVSNVCLKSLRQLPRLRQLFLWQTRVTPQAAAKFARAMIDHQELDLWQSQIDTLNRKLAEAKMNVVDGIAWNNTTALTSTMKMPSSKPNKPGKLETPDKPGEPINLFCPNSGLAINPHITLVYQGKTIGFCTQHCRDLFRKHPARFLAALHLKPQAVVVPATDTKVAPVKP